MGFASEIISRDRFLIENGSHNRDSMIIILQGQFVCEIRGRRFTASEGDICAFRSDTVFSRRVVRPLKCVYIQFDSFPIPLTPGLLTTADPVRAENTVAHLTRAVAEENAELTEHFLRDLLLLHKYVEDSRRMEDETVSGCKAYLDRNYASRISLDMLAERFSISKQGLIRKFRSSTGKTPMEYLAAVRIAQSKRLLRDTALSVSRVAEESGFENVYYFSNCFKRATGRSPSEYRRTLDL